MRYRVGENYNIHVYACDNDMVVRGVDKPIATFHDPEDAKRFVAVMNDFIEKATKRIVSIDVKVLEEGAAITLKTVRAALEKMVNDVKASVT